jgi:leader peptidase (prepilin peptidase)/N-methyltransferase
MTVTHHLVLAIMAFVLGLCVGSFLNVCVHRLPLGLSLIRPPSRCPRCRTTIRARDNLPVLGWLLLGGKCRSCRELISPRYPIIELTVGLLFAGTYLAGVALAGRDLWDDLGVGAVLARLVAGWTLIALLVVAVLIDHDTGRVPVKVTATGLVAGLVLGTLAGVPILILGLGCAMVQALAMILIAGRGR